VKRREFIALLGGAAAWPLAARSQQVAEVPRVGFVYPGSKAAAATRIEAIMSGLRVSGYAAPAQVELVARTADGDPTRIAPLVEEILAKNVNVIIANGPPVLHVARSATEPFRLQFWTVSWFLFQCRDEAFRPVRTPAS
jgi:putative tryptophan/tyrosine transport system substrate-binding protein